MSVRGEFERYLTQLISALRQRGTPSGAGAVEGMTALLEAREQALSERARDLRRLLTALSPDAPPAGRRRTEAPCASSQMKEDLEEAIDRMRQLIRVILGD